LSNPAGVAISGSDLFVANYDNTNPSSGGYIGEYTISGATVNSHLITGLSGDPIGIAISGNDLFVADFNAPENSVGEYTTSGATVNASLITGLGFEGPFAVAASGNSLFIPNSESTTIGEYTTSGVTVNASLISVAGGSPSGIAISGNDLFVVNVYNSGTIGEYTTSGATVNASLASIPNLDTPAFIAISQPSPPLLSLRGFSHGQFQLAVLGTSNEIYTVQMTTNLFSSNWTSLMVTNPPSGIFSFTDPNATNRQQFYRVEMAQ
jgi:hypothetical protein